MKQSLHNRSKFWVCLLQVKLQWDNDDEACTVCGDDEQAEGYACTSLLPLPKLTSRWHLLIAAVIICLVVNDCWSRRHLGPAFLRPQDRVTSALAHSHGNA